MLQARKSPLFSSTTVRISHVSSNFYFLYLFSEETLNLIYRCKIALMAKERVSVLPRFGFSNLRFLKLIWHPKYNGLILWTNPCLIRIFRVLSSETSFGVIFWCLGKTRRYLLRGIHFSLKLWFSLKNWLSLPSLWCLICNWPIFWFKNWLLYWFCTWRAFIFTTINIVILYLVY